MQKIIIRIMLLVSACGIVSCKATPVEKWVEFEAMPDATIYVDPSTIIKQGSHAEMWVLIDYKKPQPDKTGKQVLSDKLHYQYDCKEKQLSIITTSAHAGQMASGETINITPDPPQLTAVPEGTTAERMWQRACAGESVK
jgi:hypothetical protein